MKVSLPGVRFDGTGSEYKQEAVRLVEEGQSQASVAKTFGLVEQTLSNGVKVSRQGQLSGADSKPVNVEQMRSRGCGPSWPG